MNSIFVEGKADQKFISDLIYFLNPKLLDNVNIIITNGYTNIDKFKNEIEKTKDFGGKILIIFDADDNLKEKKNIINKISQELNTKIEIFFLPNNKDNGCLEDLLVNIINPQHQGIINCFKKYQSCLKKEEKPYTLPNKKAKIYAYLEALLPTNKKAKIKEENRDYLDKKIWNLDSENLIPLTKFIKQIL